MWWVMVTKGKGGWKYIPAEPPCMKGEWRMSFKWFAVTIGWQS